MDLNTQYRIPYLAQNPYIYGSFVPTPTIIPEKPRSADPPDEVLIASIINPIPCYQAPHKEMPKSSYLDSIMTKINPTFEQNDENKPLSQHYIGKNIRGNELESRSNSCSSSVPSSSGNCSVKEVKLLPTTLLNEDEIKKTRMEVDSELSSYLKPNNKERFDVMDLQERENYYQRPVSYASSQNKSSYQPISPSAGFNYKGLTNSMAKNYNKADDLANRSFESSVLGDFNKSRVEDRSRRLCSSCKKYDKNEDDFKRKNRPKENLYDWKAEYQENKGKRSEKAFKEDFEYNKRNQSREQLEKIYIRPSRDLWVEQAKNTNKYSSERPTLDIKADKANRSFSNNPRNIASNGKLVKMKKEVNEKEKNSKEKEQFVSVMMKVLKTHAKKCPQLRKEINAIKLSRLYSFS
jgi:hypothetical protein